MNLLRNMPESQTKIKLLSFVVNLHSITFLCFMRYSLLTSSWRCPVQISIKKIVIVFCICEESLEMCINIVTMNIKLSDNFVMEYRQCTEILQTCGVPGMWSTWGRTVLFQNLGYNWKNQYFMSTQCKSVNFFEINRRT